MLRYIFNYMVLDLPDQGWLRDRANYTNIFSLTLAWNIGFYGIFLLVLFLLFLGLKLYRIRQFNIQPNRNSLLTFEDSNRQSSEARMLENQQKIYLNPQDRIFNLINLFTSIFFYLTLIDIALLYLSFFVFGILGTGTGFDILAVVSMFFIVFVPTLLWKYKTRNQQQLQYKREIIFTAIMITIWLACSILSVIFLKGGCLCVYNQYYGLNVNKDFYISTEFSRAQKLKKVCPENQVCHLYATLPEDASTSVFLNAHTGTNVDKLIFVLQTKQTLLSVQSTNPISLGHLQQIAQRNVHSVLFKNLIPSTNYEMIVMNSEKIVMIKSNYRSLPDKNTNLLKMAVGGDVGLNHNASLLTSHLVQYDPDVILIGGDIAYDDGQQTCFYSWDNFYWIFQDLFITINRTVPMILAVGNHDVGYDSLVQLQMSKTIYEIPLFFIYNPQHLGTKNSVPQFNQRLTIHYHTLGNTVHVVLDSGYVQSFEDQIYFIQLVQQKFKTYYKFAIYHNPIYPSCANWNEGSNDMRVYQKATAFWTPLFDNFTAAFENHNHHRKFTKKIKGGKAYEDYQDGVRYIGDGSWAVTQDLCPPDRVVSGKRKEMLLDYDLSEPNHVWQITLKKVNTTSTINYTAVDMSGKRVYQKVDKL